MEPTPPGRSPPAAWQPFTFGGVAAFASGRTAWLWLLLLGAGLFLGWGAVSYLRTGFYPAVEAAIARLPAVGEIRDGLLQWPTNGVAELSNTRLLALVVNPESAPVPGQGTADVVLELTAQELTTQSLFGYWVLPYPRHGRVPLNRGELEPLWAAWEPHVRAVLPTGFVVAWIVVWITLATAVTPGLRLLAALLRREVTLGGCWRLAVAATVPALCGTAFGLVLYASRGFHLVDTLITWLLAHLYTVILWCGALFNLPKRVATSPFDLERAAPAAGIPIEAEGPERNRALEQSPFADPQARTETRNPFAVPAQVPAAEPDPQSSQTLPVSALARPRVLPSAQPDVSRPAAAPWTPGPRPTPSAAPASDMDEEPLNPS